MNGSSVTADCYLLGPVATPGQVWSGRDAGRVGPHPGRMPYLERARAWISSGERLSVRQTEVLDVIERAYTALGQAVPVTYVAKRLGWHHETAREYVAALFTKGAVLGPGSPITPSSPLAVPRYRRAYVVYFLYDRRAHLIKIGRTNDLENRFRMLRGQIKRAHGNLVLLIGALDTWTGNDPVLSEYALHAKFKSARVRGEWFDVTPELRAEISARFGVDLPAQAPPRIETIQDDALAQL